MAQISIVIPCYNAVKYITNCLDSLDKQTFKDFEVIFVDDMSSDNTYQYLQKISNSCTYSVKLLQNPQNSGPAISRNNGILAASGKYITFCDCDDWYDPFFLEKMYSLVSRNHSDICLCGYKVVDEKGNTQFRPVADKEGVISRKDAFALDADSLCMLMVKTNIMKETLLPNLRNGEDVATVPFLLIRAKTYSVTNLCLYNYFRRSNSASETVSPNVVESLLSSFEYIKKHFPKEYFIELEYLGIKNVLYTSIITLLSISYDKDRAKRILHDFNGSYPNWYSNPYLSNLRLYKKIVVFLVHKRCFFLIRLIAILRSLYK